MIAKKLDNLLQKPKKLLVKCGINELESALRKLTFLSYFSLSLCYPNLCSFFANNLIVLMIIDTQLIY